MLKQVGNFSSSPVQNWQKSLKLAQMMCDFAEKQFEDGEIVQSRLTLTMEIEKVKKERFSNCPQGIEQKRVQIERRCHEKLSEVIEICKRKSSNRNSRSSFCQSKRSSSSESQTTSSPNNGQSA